MLPLRPPRMKLPCTFHFLVIFLMVQACTSSKTQQVESLRTFVMENLYSTEHLAFGADPRAVNAVRSRTTEKDIPVLIMLLSDRLPAVVRVAQQVLVTYNNTALPYLTSALDQRPDAESIIRETVEMIERRKSP